MVHTVAGYKGWSVVDAHIVALLRRSVPLLLPSAGRDDLTCVMGASSGVQLRDLVPPQSKDSASSQDNLDPAKRPKHVVLSDTILLVKNLQNKVRLARVSPLSSV